MGLMTEVLSANSFLLATDDPPGAAPEEDSPSRLERIVLEAEDLACGPAGVAGPWRLTSAAGGRQINDADFDKPMELDWLRFSVEVMRDILAEGGVVHFDLTHMRDLTGVLDGEGTWGDAITSHELRWLRRRWDRGEGGVMFWTEVEYRGDEAWGRPVAPPWEWSAIELAAHLERLKAVGEEPNEDVSPDRGAAPLTPQAMPAS
jgi:hypothetical protein